MVERWFSDADTNTILLLLEREPNRALRETNLIRFVRLRRPLAQLKPEPGSPARRGQIEDLLQTILEADATEDDPRMQVNLVQQGLDGGLTLETSENDEEFFEEDEE